MQPSILEIYTELLAISKQMASCGIRENWDELNLLEQQRTGLIQQLPKKLSSLAPHEQIRVELMIHEIQAIDQSVLKDASRLHHQIAKLLEGLTPHNQV